MMTQKRNRLTDQEKIDVCNKYKSGNFTCSALAKEYKISVSSISNLLKRRGYTVLNKTQFVRKYSLNEHYFDDIDTEDKAYFLGLLYADGHNSDKKNCIIISLQERDKEILNKFNFQINSNRPLRYTDQSSVNPKWSNIYTLAIDSKHMSQQLTKLGCVPRKSLVLKFPNEEQVPSRLIQHFIRGYFDGDGHISYWLDKKYHKFTWSIVSTLEFCEKLKLILTELGINSYLSIRHKNRNTSTRNISISGNQQILKIIDYLYDGASVYLDRKYQKSMEMKSLYV